MVMLSGEQRTRGQAPVSTKPVVVAGRAEGPLGPWAPGFAEWLGGRGFAPETVAGYLRWLGWLSGWLAGQGLAADALTGALAAQFAASMRAAGHPKITPGRLATMLGYLREAGAVPPEDACCPPEVTPCERVLAGYREHMARRDLAPGTVAARQRPCWTGSRGPVSAASATTRSCCWWPAWDCAPARCPGWPWTTSAGAAAGW